MMRISINEFTTYRWSFEQDVEQYAAKGFHGISVWRQKLSDIGAEKALEILRTHGLPVASLLWAGGFTGSEGHSFEESVHDALDAVRLASRLNAECLVIYSGGRAGHTCNHARRLVIQGLRQVAPLAAELGITLGLEPMHAVGAEACSFVNDLDEAVELIDQVDSPGLGLVFDTYYWGHLPDVVARAERLAPRVCLVQLGDSHGPPDAEHNRCPLGNGVVPLRELVAAFHNNGYEGYFDVELVGEEIEHLCNHRLLDQTRATWEQMLSLTTVS